MTGIIQYGAGNIFSVITCFERAGEKVSVVHNPCILKKVDRLILPGVGAFDSGMRYLKKIHLYDAIKNEAKKGKPILGICLGLQMFFEKSEEGNLDGLAVLQGCVKRFPQDMNLPVPHMGWNTVNSCGKSKILNRISRRAFFYFAHSFYPVPDDGNIVSGTTTYGIRFASVVEKDNIIGVQFHPEKSAENGMILIQNFLKI